MRYPFYFTTLPNYHSCLKPSGSSRWSQRFSQALGFARIDSVSLLFASYLDDFSSLQYRYVCGWNMRYKRFHLFMDSEPDFYFICATNPPASLCASRPTQFSSEDLFTSVSETCMHHGAIRCGTFMFVLIIIFKYCDWRRTDVGPTSAGDFNPTSKWRWADIARPISTQRRPDTLPCSFFFHAITTLRRNRTLTRKLDSY